MKVFRFIVSQEKVIVPSILLVLSIILFHGIFKTYAFTDDYDFLLNASHPDFINVFIQGGRPIFGFLMKLFFSSFNSVEEAYVIRIFSLFGALLFVNCFYFFLRNNGFSLFFSFFVALLLLFSPSLDIKVIWTLAFSKPYVSILALVAGHYTCKAIDTSPKYGFLAILFGLTVLLTYQPIYTLSVIPIFLKWMKNKYDHKSILKILVLHLVIYVIYYATFKLSLILFDLSALDRSGVSLNLFERTWWFITGPVERALVYNFLFYKRAVLWVILSMSIVSIGYYVITVLNRKRAGLHVFYLTGFFYLSMLPNILSSDDWISYRTMGTLIIIIILIYAYMIHQIKHKLIRVSVIVLISIVAFINAFYNVNSGFINNQVREFSHLKGHLENNRLNDNRYLFLQPEVNFLDSNNFLERVITDEYGRLSTSSDWVPGPIVKLIYKGNNKPLPLVKLLKNEEQMDSSYTIINMPKIFLENND